MRRRNLTNADTKTERSTDRRPAVVLSKYTKRDDECLPEHVDMRRHQSAWRILREWIEYVIGVAEVDDERIIIAFAGWRSLGKVGKQR